MYYVNTATGEKHHTCYSNTKYIFLC